MIDFLCEGKTRGETMIVRYDIILYIYIYIQDVSIKELHEEVKQHKKEIKELRQFISSFSLNFLLYIYIYCKICNILTYVIPSFNIIFLIFNLCIGVILPCSMNDPERMAYDHIQISVVGQ